MKLTDITELDLKFAILQSCANMNLKPLSGDGGGFVEDVNEMTLTECREDGATHFDIFLDNLIQHMADNGDCFEPAGEDDVEVIAAELKELAKRFPIKESPNHD